MMKLIKISGYLIALIWLINAGCSSRVEEVVYTADSTFYFPAKQHNGLYSSIQLYRSADKKTGKLIGEGNVFTICENGNIRALVKFEHLFDNDQQLAVFHIDWISPDGRSVYRKQLDIAAGDSINTIESSISISPEKRIPGKYELRVYYFRELIAGEHFEILPEFKPSAEQAKTIEAQIILYRKTSKNSGKRIGEGTIFTMKKGRNVRAHINLGNRFVFGNHDLNFRLEWVGSDNKVFYQKEIILYPNDSSASFGSSISISPRKREAGNYFIRLSLADKIIAEQAFVLQK